MKAATTFALVFLIFAAASYADEEWPLVINTDPTWQIEYQGDGIHFFTLTRPEGENVFFILPKWTAPGGREQIPSILGRIAESFSQEERTKLIPYVTKAGYRSEKIVGDKFSGEAAVFTNWDSTLLVMFMVSDGDGIWEVQYSGSKAIWEKAKIVLQNLRRSRKIPPSGPTAILLGGVSAGISTSSSNPASAVAATNSHR